MKKSAILLTCATGIMSLSAAIAPARQTAPAPTTATYSHEAMQDANTLILAQTYGTCTGPQYGAMVQQCIATRCATAPGSVAQCAASCEAQVRAQCGMS